MTGLDLLKVALSKLGKHLAPTASSTVTLRQLVVDAAALTGKTIAAVSNTRVTVMSLLQEAIGLSGKNLAPTAQSSTTLRQLIIDAVSLAGKQLAVVSETRTTGTELLQEALGLLQSDMSDTTDYEAAALVYINRLLVDLFNVNNISLEANGSAALTEAPSLTSLSSEIPYEQEIVRNIMLYGLCRDIGMPLQNANMGYFASTYDEQKKRYTVCESGELTKTAVASANRMLADLFAINNDLLTLAGETELNEIPTVAVLADALTYQDVLVRDVMLTGLAADISDDKEAKDLLAQYNAKVQAARVTPSGNLKQISIDSINQMLVDLHSANNSALEAAGSAAIAEPPTVSDIGDSVPYELEIASNIMLFGLCRDIGLPAQNANAGYFATAYDERKKRYTICAGGKLTQTAIASANKMLADLFPINNDMLTVAGSAKLTTIPTVDAMADVLPYRDVIVRGVMVHGLAEDLSDPTAAKPYAEKYAEKKAGLTISASGDVAQDALSSINGMLADLFNVNNGLLEAAAQDVLTEVPELTALSESLPYNTLLNRNVMPFGMARDFVLSENNLNAANIYAAQYEAGKNRQTVAVVSTITDMYGGIEE